MAAAMLLDEELRNGLGTSEEDAEFEEDDDPVPANAYAANAQLHNGMVAGQIYGDLEDEDINEDEEMLSDADAEGELDDEMEDPDEPHPEDNGDEGQNDSEEEDEDAEGVGAVKIQPGALEEDEDVVSGSEEEEEDDEDSSASIDDEDDDSKDSTDAEVEVLWHSAAEEEEEEEPANPNRCIFCQQDEENDPSEVFEMYLACDVCGDNAHPQCARNADAFKPDEVTEQWICPECVVNNLQPEPIVPNPEEQEALAIAARRISRDRVPGDLLPSQRGTIKPDSHSVFNQLIAPDDPMDGSRLLRKRKASSDLASNEVGSISPIKTRTRDKEITVESSSELAVAQVKSQLAAPDEAMGLDLPPPLTNGHNKNVEPSLSPRVSRSMRPKPTPKVYPASITLRTPTSIKIRFRIDPARLRSMLLVPPKPKKKRNRGGAAPARTNPDALTSTSTIVFTPSTYAQPFYSLHEKEIDELKSKPYGGILTEVEADTALTLPKPEHRRQFDEARQNAEEDWKARVAAAAEAATASGIKKARKVSGPASQIEYIEFGQYQIDIWYAAPYPEEYSRNKALFICEFCLKYMESDIVAWRHKTKCHWKHPPGDEIYRDGKVMIFEVDGRKNPLYCQNLCLLAKLFLGSKTLYYDVEPFLFYVMTEYDELGCHFVGYFSKEKRPSSLNNVSCILVLPIHQRKGYGHLLIDFSYLLTRAEKKTGSPEKPLSDMGLVSYRNYWRLIMCYYLQHYNPSDQMPSVRRMSDELGLTPDDVISALDALGSLVRDSLTGTYAFKLRTQYYKEVIRHHEDKNYATLNPKGLVWTPYIMGRGNASSFDHAPPLHNIAQRDEDEEESDGETNDSGTGNRNFITFSGNSNDGAESITESLEKLTTKPGINGSSATNGSKKPSYFETASSIPAVRFEVFPPAPGARKPPAPRPSASRSTARPRSSLATAVTPTRPKPRSRSSANSSRRNSTPNPTLLATATPRTRQKQPGSTSRASSRWPRGIIKSDIADEESESGMPPPRLITRRSRLGNEVILGEEEEEDDDLEDEENAEDGAEVSDGSAIIFNKPRQARQKSSGRSGAGMGKPILDGRLIKGIGKGKLILTDNDDRMESVMRDDDEDQMDIDADGEEE